MPAEYGAQGALAKSMIEQYVAGVNAYVQATRTNPLLLPADYLAAVPDVVAALEQLLGQHPVDGFGPAITSRECRGGPATCGASIDAALARTYSSLVSANKTSNVAAWTACSESAAATETMPVHDAIHFRALGLVGQPAIDWRNRSTFQQVIEFPRHRAR